MRRGAPVALSADLSRTTPGRQLGCCVFRWGGLSQPPLLGWHSFVPRSRAEFSFCERSRQGHQQGLHPPTDVLGSSGSPPVRRLLAPDIERGWGCQPLARSLRRRGCRFAVGLVSPLGRRGFPLDRVVIFVGREVFPSPGVFPLHSSATWALVHWGTRGLTRVSYVPLKAQC